MDELKLLVEMVASLPAMAVWVIAFFFVYKVVCIGSIYGLVRFGIDKLHSWLVSPVPLRKKIVEVENQIQGITITGEMGDLMAQLRRLRGKNVGIKSEYIHSQSVRWLADAIDEKEERERIKPAA